MFFYFKILDARLDILETFCRWDVNIEVYTQETDIYVIGWTTIFAWKFLFVCLSRLDESRNNKNFSTKINSIWFLFYGLILKTHTGKKSLKFHYTRQISIKWRCFWNCRTNIRSPIESKFYQIIQTNIQSISCIPKVDSFFLFLSKKAKEIEAPTNTTSKVTR